jgi:oligopeptidase B
MRSSSKRAGPVALVLGCALVLAACARTQPSPKAGAIPAAHASSRLPTPPVAPRRPHLVRSPFGDRSDEYYWLRDDTRSDPEVLAYLGAEDAYTERMLQPLAAARSTLYRELVGRIAPDDVSVPVRENGYWYFTRFVANREYAQHLRRQDRAGATEELLLDENELARGHGYFHLGGHEPSPSGRVLAWAEDPVGRGQHVIRFKRLDSGELLADTLTNTERALAWADDEVLLYVEKDPETLLGTRVRAHRLGTEAAHDRVIYEEHDHTYYLTVFRGRSQRYLNIYLMATDSSEQWVARADDPALHFERLIPRRPGHEYFAQDHDVRWIVRSNAAAPNFRLIEAAASDLTRPERWRELVPEPSAGLIEDFDVFERFVAYTARSAARLSAFVLPFSGAPATRIELPGDDYTVRLGDNREPNATALRLEYTALSVPERVYDYDVSSARLSLRKEEPVLGGFDAAHYESAQLSARGRDGTSIPVSLAFRKGVARDGSAPLYLMGYGAYGASEDPEFVGARVSLLDRGVVLAIAHVRGGQELGRDWYEQGRKLRKQNTFHDFIDVTELLIEQGYAAKQRVAARGASAGGLLIGAVANMAPERFAVLVAHVPFVDVVTTMLDDTIPLTSNEYDEWGDPRQKADYASMLAYSPYDNVRRTAYPALFVSTSLWDSQVQYYEPAKWVARLRAHKTDPNPLLFRVHMQGSHAGRSGRFARQAQLADEYAFVLDRLGVPVTPLPSR